jgi:Zn-dependent protease with chaperone function
MITAALLAAVLLASQAVMWALIRARWTWRATRTAIVTWQAVGLAWALSAVGIPLSIGLEPYGESLVEALPAFTVDVARGLLPAPWRLIAICLGLALGALFVATHVSSLVQAVRARARHRALLALVARRDAAAPGVLVLDHPAAAAYCLPGLRSTVVVSAGALALLDRVELAAVLTHERAHAHERHDLVLLPFTALCRFIELCRRVARRPALPGRRWPRSAFEAVALLIEMRADDRALRQHGADRLAAALQRFAATGAPAPAGALGVIGHQGAGATDDQLAARIERVLELQRAHSARPSHALPAYALSVALVLLATSISLLG